MPAASSWPSVELADVFLSTSWRGWRALATSPSSGSRRSTSWHERHARANRYSPGEYRHEPSHADQFEFARGGEPVGTQRRGTLSTHRRSSREFESCSSVLRTRWSSRRLTLVHCPLEEAFASVPRLRASPHQCSRARREGDRGAAIAQPSARPACSRPRATAVVTRRQV
jgi:hypothetical protein